MIHAKAGIYLVQSYHIPLPPPNTCIDFSPVCPLQIYDCCRYKQMPETDQIADISLHTVHTIYWFQIQVPAFTCARAKLSQPWGQLTSSPRGRWMEWAATACRWPPRTQWPCR